MVRVYFEATTHWEAEINPSDLEDGDILCLGPVTGDLAEHLELHGFEVDGPDLTITGIDPPRTE